MVTDVIVVGAGGFGRTVSTIIQDVIADGGAINLIGLVDDAPTDDQSNLAAQIGVEHLGHTGRLKEVPSTTKFLVASGSGTGRKAVAERVHAEFGLGATSVVHPTAYLASSANIGDGTIVSIGVTITTLARVGSFSLLNINSLVSHDCDLGPYTTLSPYACMLGGSTTGEGAWLSTRSTLSVNCRLGSWSVLGASATALKSVADGATAVGTPAREREAR